VVKSVGYPVLVRPSYVLGGQGMQIVINDEELESAVIGLLKSLPGNRVLIDHFLDRAEEAESDSICDGHEVLMVGLMEHIEPAGIHSGDSFAVLPPFNLSTEVLDKMREYTQKIAFALHVKGLLNIQFAIKNNQVYVIEANPRASRTVPFISKAYGVPFINLATQVMLGNKQIKDFKIHPFLKGYAIKEPIFSFNKFPEVAKELGPEMKSTGEAISFIDTLDDPLFKHLYNEKSMYLSR
jgi:carbamoyl-phosphate synthase large subunit